MRRRLTVVVMALLLVAVTPGVASADPVLKAENTAYVNNYIECLGERVVGNGTWSILAQWFTDGGGNRHLHTRELTEVTIVGEDTGTMWKMRRTILENVMFQANTDSFRQIIPGMQHVTPVGGPGPVLLVDTEYKYMVIDGNLVLDSSKIIVRCVGQDA